MTRARIRLGLSILLIAVAVGGAWSMRAIWSGERLREPSSQGAEEEVERESAADVFFAAQAHRLLKLPKLFPSGDLKDWREAAVRARMPSLEFRSRVLGQHRAIFFEETRDYDRWILAVGRTDQIESRDADGNVFYTPRVNRDRVKLVDLILLDKRTSPPKIYFKEFRMAEGKLAEATEPEACYACHASGLREIQGATELTARFISGWDEGRSGGAEALAAARREDFNRKMRAYGLPDWHGAYAPEKRYPWIGTVNGAAREGAGACVKCHDGDDRGGLSVLTDREEIRAKLLEDRSMPPGFKGDDLARERLFEEIVGPGYESEVERFLERVPTKWRDPAEVERFFGRGDPE